MLLDRNPLAEAEALTELWAPKVIGEVDNNYVKVAKVKGKFCWHAHDDEDEMFFVLKGQLRIELESQTVELNTGDMFVVPKGIQHNPVAEEECCLMLFEKKSTQHTGEIVTDQTRTIEDQLS